MIIKVEKIVDKIKAINTIREITGFDLKEAKDFVDDVEAKGFQTFVISNEEASLVLSKLKSAGIIASIDYNKEDSIYENNNIDSLQVKKTIKNLDKEYDKKEIKEYSDVNIINSNDISKLDRESTMEMLFEVGQIAKKSEEYEIELVNLNRKKQTELNNAEEIRKTVSKRTKNIIRCVTIVAAIVGTFIVPVLLTFVFGAIALLIMNMTIKKADLKKHEQENNDRYNAYIEQNVFPIQNRIDEVSAMRGELEKSGKLDWAIDVVGKEMFYSTCIEDLYKLIKTRRADNLKEALNKYDDTQYKNRIEEIQSAIQNASEISAEESVKQTIYTQEIAKNTHQTATAAKATAYHTRQIDKNIRRTK